MSEVLTCVEQDAVLQFVEIPQSFFDALKEANEKEFNK